MSIYNGWHIQEPVPDWPRSVRLQPAGTLNKSVDNVHTLSEAKGNNQDTLSLYRKWYDPQSVFGGDWEANLQKARDFFNSFVDGTFLEHAHNIDYINGWNEYVAPSLSPEEWATRNLWVQASQWVWANEYRTRSELAHIRLASVSAAVGNDISLEMAQAVADNDGVLDYHCYVPVRADNGRIPYAADMAMLATHPPRARFTGTAEPYFVTPPPTWEDNNRGVITPDEWQWYSGRWSMMDDVFTANGIYCDWLFGEGGAVLQYEHGGLGPLDGWRHRDVFNGQVAPYLDLFKYWMDKANEWNHYHNNRAIGCTLFTTGGPGSTWDDFEIRQPEMDTIAQFMADYAPPEFPPIDPPDPPTEPEEPMEYKYPTRRRALIDGLAPFKDGLTLEIRERTWDSENGNQTIRTRTIDIEPGLSNLLISVLGDEYIDADDLQPVGEDVDRPIGCDVSHWQGVINFNTMYEAGARWCYIKVSEGAAWHDPNFATYWPDARQTPLKLSGYHFWRQAAEAVTQADNFINRFNAVTGRMIGDFPHIADVEDTNVATLAPSFSRFLDDNQRMPSVLEYLSNRLREAETGEEARVPKGLFINFAAVHPEEVMATPEDEANLRGTFQRIASRSGVDPWAYTGSWYWDPRFGHLDFSQYRHIEAEYNNNPDLPPSPSQGLGPIIAHQFGQREGSLYGCSSSLVDVNVLYGRLSELTV